MRKDDVKEATAEGAVVVIEVCYAILLYFAPSWRHKDAL